MDRDTLAEHLTEPATLERLDLVASLAVLVLAALVVRLWGG